MGVPTVSLLLRAPKTAHVPERVVPKAHPSHRQWDLGVTADTIEGDFVVYFRVNVRLPEVLSVGLRYRPPRGPPSVLLRVNSDHGGHGNPDGSLVEGAHVHAPLPSHLPLPLPPVPWSQGPAHAYPLGVRFLTLVEAWRLLAEAANIDNTADVRAVVTRVQNRIASGQLDLS